MSEKKYPVGEVRVYFVFKHPKTGEEMSSKLYTPLELLDTDLSIINERTCVCDCKPVGETNVVECNCEDYYQDFQFHSYQVELAQPGPMWVKASTWPKDHNMVHWRRVEDKRPLLVIGRNYQDNIVAQFGKVYTPEELEWLDESPAEQPVREVDAEGEFAEWAATIAFFDDGTRLWELLGEGEAINGQFRFTTKEFYDIFQQQKPGSGEKEVNNG